MGKEQFYLDAVRLHVELTGLMVKTAGQVADQCTDGNPIIDCLTLCLSDLEQTLASNSGKYPDFSESVYHSLKQFESHKDWFHQTYGPGRR